MLNYKNDDDLNRKSGIVNHALWNVFVLNENAFSTMSWVKWLHGRRRWSALWIERIFFSKPKLVCTYFPSNIFKCSSDVTLKYTYHSKQTYRQVHVRVCVCMCMWRFAIITKLLSHLLTVTHTQTPIKINFYYISLIFSVLAHFCLQNIWWRMRLLHELYMHVHWMLAWMGCKCKHKCKCTRYYMNMCPSRDHSRAHTAHTHTYITY